MVTVINGSTENCSLLSSGGSVSKVYVHQSSTHLIQFLKDELIGWIGCAGRRENHKLFWTGPHNRGVSTLKFTPKLQTILNNTRIKGNVLK